MLPVMIGSVSACMETCVETTTETEWTCSNQYVGRCAYWYNYPHCCAPLSTVPDHFCQDANDCQQVTFSHTDWSCSWNTDWCASATGYCDGNPHNCATNYECDWAIYEHGVAEYNNGYCGWHYHHWLNNRGLEENIVDTKARRLVEDSCVGVDYQLSLFAMKGPHFFLGAVPEDPSNSHCPSLSFVSMDGEKHLLRGDEQDVKEMLRYNEEEGWSYKLGDILQAFDGADPITGAGYDFENNSCLHFVARIARQLGISETKEMADFVVDALLSDENLIALARNSKGGTGAMAATLFGPNILRGYVEELVFSQFRFAERNLRVEEVAEVLPTFDGSAYGIEVGFDKRHLSGACSQEMYDVQLVVSHEDVSILLEPTESAVGNGCQYHWLHASVNATGFLEKQSFQLSDIHPLRDELAIEHGSEHSMGSYMLNRAINAYESASLNGDTFDLINNNVGEFVCDFLRILGHQSSPDEATWVASALSLTATGLADLVRAEGPAEAGLNAMSDLDVVFWLVERCTSRMYGDASPSG